MRRLKVLQRGIISGNREKPRNCAALFLISVMLACAAADPKTPASHPLFCQRAICGMASFLTFPCPLLQLRAEWPSRPQLLHFWGDFLCKEPTRQPQFASGIQVRPPRSKIDAGYKSLILPDLDAKWTGQKFACLFDRLVITVSMNDVTAVDVPGVLHEHAIS